MDLCTFHKQYHELVILNRPERIMLVLVLTYFIILSSESLGYQLKYTAVTPANWAEWTVLQRSVIRRASLLAS